MFSSSPSYAKLKTNLRLVVNRLKLLEKKKTEIALKARKDIADYISAGKDDRGRIRVEHIIREDYLVEAMELVEMYCDLLLARFGIIQTMKEVDPGLEEAIATIIWATPRLQSDVPEFKILSDQLTNKYGKVFAEACRGDTLRNVSEKVKNKLDVRAPPAMLVERYMIEIAKAYNVPFEPDPSVFREAESCASGNLLDFGDDTNSQGPPGDGGFGGGAGGFGGGGGGGFGDKSCSQEPFPQVPSGPGNMPYPGSNMPYPSAPSDGSRSGGFMMPQPQPYMMPPPTGPSGHSAPPGFMDEPTSLPPPYEPRDSRQDQEGPLPDKNPNFSAPPGPANPNYSAPPPANPPGNPPNLGLPPPPGNPSNLGLPPPPGNPSNLGLPPPPSGAPPGGLSVLPNLPDVPSLSPGNSTQPSGPNDSGPTDFDDLSKRFEELKKRK